MQSSSLPIQLNSSQLSLLTQTETDLTDQSKHHQLILFICIILSLLIHSLLLFGPFNIFNFHIQPTTKINKTFNISLQKMMPTEISNEAFIEALLVEENLIPIKVEDTKIESTSQTNANKNNQIKPNKKQNKQELDQAEKIISTQSLRDSFANKKIINELEQQAVDPNFVVFDPRLRNSLKEVVDKQKDAELIEAERQFRQDNEFFEYQEVGGQKIVRIDGNCFIVPAKDPFALVQNDWIILGPCENQKKLNIKPGLFSHKYKPEDDDRYDKKTK